MRHSAALLGLGLSALSCGSSSSSGGESHWLRRCASDRDCDLGAVCVDRVCGAAVVTPPRAADYFSVDAGVVVPPYVEARTPGSVVRRSDPTWVGVWATHPAAPCGAGGLACLRLALDAEGNGSVTWLSPAEPAGPFEPPTDPSTGYPPGIAPSGYAAAAAAPLSGVAYRVLDGFVDGETLSFWVSPVDLWTDWCALASPFPAAAGPAGITHRCVPEGATTADTEPGRLALCGWSCLVPGNCETPLCSCDRSGCRAALQNEAIPFTVRRISGSRLVGALSPARSAKAVAFELEGPSR